MFSSVLGLQRIEVNGAHRVSVATVESAADVATGTPLARIDLGAVERRIEQIPAVASATVHRGWPHSLVISVTERTPLAAVHEHGRWWLMDRTGALFGSSASPNPGEPIVEIDGGPGPQTLREAAGVLGLLPADVSALTKRVSASSVDSITLHLTDGAQVRWGSAADGAQKAAVLRALLRHKAAFYDVSIPSQPAIKGR
jgi:cell division protein FtsQ